MTTIADVTQSIAERALSDVEQLASAIQKVAPGAWAMAVRKQQWDGAIDVALGLVCLVAVAGCLRLVWKATAEESFDRDVPRYFSGAVALAIALGLVLGLIGPGTLRLTNPEFYAAQAVAAMVVK